MVALHFGSHHSFLFLCRLSFHKGPMELGNFLALFFHQPSFYQAIGLACRQRFFSYCSVPGRGLLIQNSLRRMLIHVRKGWSLLLLYILGAIFIPFVNSADTFENWVIAAIPFAAFHASAYLYSTFRIFPLVLFWLS